MQIRIDQTKIRRSGVTLPEVLVSVIVVALLIALVIPALARARRLADHTSCHGNLRIAGLAFRIFATENTNAFPFRMSTNLGGTREWKDDASETWRHFAAASNEMGTPMIARCPHDPERRKALEWAEFTNNSHLSYFMGVNAIAENPHSILAGDRNLTLDGVSLGNRVVTFPTNAAVGFDGRVHQVAGNILLGDGSVEQVTSARLGNLFLDTALTMTNTLSIP